MNFNKEELIKSPLICSVNGCDNTNIIAKGLCIKHYKQMYRHGKILERTIYDKNNIIENDEYIEIVLYDKECDEVGKTIIDKEDYYKMQNKKICLLNIGYAYLSKENKYVHEIIMGDYDKSKFQIDHINKNKLDNRKCNLKLVTQLENLLNKNIQSNNKSGVRGVRFNVKKNKWIARIGVNKKDIHLYQGDSFEEAVRIRKENEIKYYGRYL